MHVADLEYSKTERTAGTLRLWKRELNDPLPKACTTARTDNGQATALCEDRKSESGSVCMSG